MMESFGKHIATAQSKHPWMFVIVFLVITALLTPGIFHLIGNIEPSIEKLLPQDVQEVRVMNDMRAQFGSDMMYILIYPEGTVSDVRDPVLLSYMDTLAQTLLIHEQVLDVRTLADVVKMENDGVIPDSILETRELLKQSPRTLQYVSADYDLAIIEIRSDTGANAQVIKSVVESIEEDIEHLEIINPGSRYELTGFNAIDKATFEIIMSDFASITFVSMALIAVVVFFTFGSLGRGMMPMVVVMVALLWTMGIAGYLNLTITVVSMVAAAMIMGLGIDFGIHIVHTYFELRKKQQKEQALTSTLSELLRATTAASLTTMAGFSALLWGVLPAMKTLAIILMMGIFTTLLGAIFLLPAIVYLADRGGKK
ncbi:MMPL family transporter [Candidatus Woesearchaeota archaeon]|nr:MMPL family transporter [Candidatus Woesearchaeota archaeon]